MRHGLLQHGYRRMHSAIPDGDPADVRCQCETGVLDGISGLCVCSGNGQCDTGCCNTVTGECTADSAITDGDPADARCQCETGVLDGISGLCVCLFNGQCDTGCCNTVTGRCTADSEITDGDPADVRCQCETNVLDRSSGLCVCIFNGQCDTGCCNTVTGLCTVGSLIAEGLSADVRCQCETGVLDDLTGLCECRFNNQCDTDCCNTVTGECTAGGLFADSVSADVRCQCETGFLHESTGLCGCIFNGQCDTGCCNTVTGECTAGSLISEGVPADVRCQCETGVLDESTGLCECRFNNQCDTGCCNTVRGECADTSVTQGGTADVECQCISSSINDAGICECVNDSECELGDICCPEDHICREPDANDPTACGDPHMTGFHGQKFDFTGKDGGWYALVSDPPSMHLNMRVTAPVPSLPEITYITGLSLLTTDADGVDHSVVISVKHPHSIKSDCPKGIHPCLADGSLNVVADGDEVLVAPGTVTLGPGVQVTAVNIPGECRSFGFETYWERKKQEQAQSGRRLQRGQTLGIGEWILADPTATNMVECTTYVARAMSDDGAIFVHQSEHASFQIVTPTGTIRLSHGRLHQLPMRNPTDQFDLPDHLTWQMNMAVDHTNIGHDAQGILGETFVPTRDRSGNTIMHGMECIRGEEADYAVAGPLGMIFTQGEHSS